MAVLIRAWSEPCIVPVLRGIRLGELNTAIRRETRNREIYTPVISVFRWWARRSHVLFGTLLEEAQAVLGGRLLVVDPFAGGGTTLVEALRLGHSAYVQDINPWAVQGMRAIVDLRLVSEDRLRWAEETLRAKLKDVLERAYRVGDTWTTHTFRVAVAGCPSCGADLWLFPYALVSMASRRSDEDGAWYACNRCGFITKGSRRLGVRCRGCTARLRADAHYLPARTATCPECGSRWRLSALLKDGARYRVVLVERALDGERWLDWPSERDLEASEGWPDVPLPVGEIPQGKETAVLLRHGFKVWRDLYPARQRAVLCAILDAVKGLAVEPPVSDVLRIAAVGAAEMAGLASRWDRYYLKAYESTAGHRFTFAPFTAEVNVWGDETSGRGTFVRRLRQLRKAVRWVAPQRMAGTARVVCGASQSIDLPTGAADLVLTDPPYFGDVQYGELSGLFLAWLGAAWRPCAEEVVVDGHRKGRDDYTWQLAAVLAEARRVTRPGGRLIMTFHNRDPRAFGALADALRSAGWMILTWDWVASENERDFAKRNKRSCTMDLVLECVNLEGIEPDFPPEPSSADKEAHFLFTAGLLLACAARGEKAPREIERILASHPFLAVDSP